MCSITLVLNVFRWWDYGYWGCPHRLVIYITYLCLFVVFNVFQILRMNSNSQFNLTYFTIIK